MVRPTAFLSETVRSRPALGGLRACSRRGALALGIAALGASGCDPEPTDPLTPSQEDEVEVEVESRTYGALPAVDGCSLTECTDVNTLVSRQAAREFCEARDALVIRARPGQALLEPVVPVFPEDGFASMVCVFGNELDNTIVVPATGTGPVLGGSRQQWFVWGFGGHDTIVGNFYYARGGTGNDEIVGELDDPAFRARAYGDSGNDVVSTEGSMLADLGPGNDTFNGGHRPDWVYGRSGDDTLRGRGGKDRLYAGGGADFVRGGGDDDVVAGGPGRDDVEGGSGTDMGQADEVAAGGMTTAELSAPGYAVEAAGTCFLARLPIIYDGVGSAASECLIGTQGPDVLKGGGGNDFLIGFGGDDELFGGPGMDKVVGGDGDDLLDGGIGDDELHGNAGEDLLRGRQGNDLLVGDNMYDPGGGVFLFDYGYVGPVSGPAGDELIGGSGDDILLGGEGPDLLVGQDGDDLFHGAQGADQIAGGEGEDRVISTDLNRSDCASIEHDEGNRCR